MYTFLCRIISLTNTTIKNLFFKFLEILIILIGALGWLIVFLFKVRTELNWEAAWRCTNFRPLLLEMLIMTQVDNFDLKYKFSFQRFLLEFF